MDSNLQGFLAFLVIIAIIALPRLINFIKRYKLKKFLDNSTDTEYKTALKEQQNQYDKDVLKELENSLYTSEFKREQYRIRQHLNELEGYGYNYQNIYHPLSFVTRRTIRKYCRNQHRKSIEVNDQLEKAREDLKNFKIIDNINIKSDTIAEGNTINKLTENNIDLDIESFKKLCNNIFRILSTGTIDEIESIKNFLDNDISNRFINQICQFKKDNLDYKREELLINEISLFDFEKIEEISKLKVFVKANLKEYIVDKNTGKILRGNPNIMIEKQILLTFIITNSNPNWTLIKYENIT